MIFVTLGSQKFQFNRLLQKLDDLIEAGIVNEKVIAQIGSSTYLPKHYEYMQFMDREKFSEIIEMSDLVITHGGTGVIIGAVKKGKRVIAVPRLARYGEHVDDHQLQLLQQFDDLRIICACYDIENLGKLYQSIYEMEFRPYVSNTKAIIDSIDEYLQVL